MPKQQTKDIPESLKKSIEALEVISRNVAQNHKITFAQVIELLKENQQAVMVPSFILRDASLGILESVVKYLKEEFDLSYHNIAVMLNRDDRVIWTTYHKASKKKKEKFEVEEPNYWIPVSILADNALGPLEAISKYLVDNAGFDFARTGRLLNRNNKSIWAAYNKAKLKEADEK